MADSDCQNSSINLAKFGLFNDFFVLIFHLEQREPNSYHHHHHTRASQTILSPEQTVKMTQQRKGMIHKKAAARKYALVCWELERVDEPSIVAIAPMIQMWKCYRSL